MMSGTGGRSGTPEGNIARSFPAARLTSQTHSTKRRAAGKDRRNGFSPQGCPPTGIDLFAEGRLGKGGSGKGLRGKPLGGKTKRYTSPPVADEQPRRKLKEKGDQKKKGKPRKWFPFFSVLRQFAFIRSSVHTHQSQNCIDTRLSPKQSNLHQRQSILLNLQGFSHC